MEDKGTTNRTKVELKFQNYNANITEAHATNRTKVELKSHQTCRNPARAKLPIVPKWN